MGQCDLTQSKSLVLLLLLKKLTVEFHRFDLACEVIKVNRNCISLNKFDAFYSNLVVFFDLLCMIVTLELVDVVFLVWFVLLNGYYLFKTLYGPKFKLNLILIPNLTILEIKRIKALLAQNFGIVFTQFIFARIKECSDQFVSRSITEHDRAWLL